MGHGLNAGNGGDRRPRAGRDDDLVDGDALSGRFDAAFDQKRRPFAIDDVVVSWQQVDVFGPAQIRDQGVLLADRRPPVSRVGLGRDAREASGRARVVKRLGGADEGLRRHAADIDASAPDHAVSDERHLRPLVRGGDRRRKPRRSGADDGEVEAAVAAFCAWRAAIAHSVDFRGCSNGRRISRSRLWRLRPDSPGRWQP